jgi:hypothetical protein
MPKAPRFVKVTPPAVVKERVAQVTRLHVIHKLTFAQIRAWVNQQKDWGRVTDQTLKRYLALGKKDMLARVEKDKDNLFAESQAVHADLKNRALEVGDIATAFRIQQHLDKLNGIMPEPKPQEGKQPHVNVNVALFERVNSLAEQLRQRPAIVDASVPGSLVLDHDRTEPVGQASAHPKTNGAASPG